jgi:hypothetical protein
MPIDYREYHPKWFLIRRKILARAQHKCEWCGVPNYAQVVRLQAGSSDWIPAEEYKNGSYPPEVKITKIVLTIAHLDRDISNNNFLNLKAGCQWCHLNHDRPHHVRARKYGRKWKHQPEFPFE